MRSRQRWPASIMLVRHGASVGNVARDLAESTGSPVIDIAERDMDVPLSPKGIEQSEALGQWLGGLGRQRPSVVLTSPYARGG